MTPKEATPEPEMPSMMPVDLRDDGLLWLINRCVFHPRGFALAVDPSDNTFSLMGDGSETWSYGLDEEPLFASAKACFDRAAQQNRTDR